MITLQELQAVVGGSSGAPPGGGPGPGMGPGPGQQPPMPGDGPSGGSGPPRQSGPGPSGPIGAPPGGGMPGPSPGGGPSPPGSDGGGDAGPPPGGCVQCGRRRLEILPGETENAKLHLQRRLEGSSSTPPDWGAVRRLQVPGSCCPAPPGEQPSAGQLEAMALQSTNDKPLQTGSKVNACSFTEFFDMGLGQCVSGRCRTPNTRPDSDRFCQPIPDAELAGIDRTAPVTDTLRLSGLPPGFNMEDVLTGKSRAEFDQEFARELAEILNIPVSMIEVQSIAEGSVVVNFRIIQTTEEDSADLVPAVVQMSLSSVRQNLNSVATAGSLLSNTDSAHGVSAPTASQRAQEYSNEEALMQAFDGSALEKVPGRSIETSELYSLSPISIGGRSKANEYLPADRSKPTQDEKWEQPSKVDIDVAIFITPVHQKVEKYSLCPVYAMYEDPVTAMWQKDGGYGGNFLANSPEMMEFKNWRVPADRRVSVSDCDTYDYFEELMKDKAARSGQEFFAPDNIYTSENLINQDFCLPDEVWENTSCEEMTTLQSSYRDQFRVSCNRELFASSEMRYTVTMPLNDKWIQAENRRPGSVYKPEWIVDTMQSYFFTWDATAEETEKMFSDNAPAGGDVQLSYDERLCAARDAKVPCPVPVLYTGKTIFKGEHSGNARKVLEKTQVSLSHLPASSPTLMPVLEIHLDINRTVALVRRGRPQWWPTDEAKLRDVLQCNVKTYFAEHREECREIGVDQQPVFPFHVDLEEAMGDVTSARDKSMTLQPGHAHIIDVSVAVIPLYAKDMFGSVSIATFYIELEAIRVYKQALGFKERNEAQIRVKFRLSEKAKALMRQPVMPWATFLSQAGAWFGIWGIASVVLSGLYSTLKMWGDLGPRDGELTMEEYQEQHTQKVDLKKKRAARKIKAQLEEEYKANGLQISYQKVYDLLVQPSSTTNLRKRVLLKDVLKGSDPLVDLPEHVVSLLGEVRVHMDDNYEEADDDSEADEAMITEMEEREKKQGSARCPMQ